MAGDKLIYLAGGIKSNPATKQIRDVYTPGGDGWRDLARSELAPRFKVLDPTKKVGGFAYGVNEIVDLDLFDIKRATAVLMEMMDPDYPYTGTTQEMVYAKLYGTPVVLFTTPRKANHPWIIYHATKIVPSLGEAIDFIKERF